MSSPSRRCGNGNSRRQRCGRELSAELPGITVTDRHEVHARGLAVMAVAGIMTLAAPYLAPGLTWAPLAVFLGAAAVAVARRASGLPSVTTIVGVSFALRAALAIALFYISYLQLPIA